MATTARWSYYISTYAMRDLTEGIDLSKIDWPFLKRNMPPVLETEEEYNTLYTPQWNEDGLVIRISPATYSIVYEAQTQDWWIHDEEVRRRGLGGMDEVRRERKSKFEGLFGAEGIWAKALGVGEKEDLETKFKNLVGKPALLKPATGLETEKVGGGDDVMSGT